MFGASALTFRMKLLLRAVLKGRLWERRGVPCELSRAGLYKLFFPALESNVDILASAVFFFLEQFMIERVPRGRTQ